MVHSRVALGFVAEVMAINDPFMDLDYMVRRLRRTRYSSKECSSGTR